MTADIVYAGRSTGSKIHTIWMVFMVNEWRIQFCIVPHPILWRYDDFQRIRQKIWEKNWIRTAWTRTKSSSMVIQLEGKGSESLGKSPSSGYRLRHTASQSILSCDLTPPFSPSSSTITVVGCNDHVVTFVAEKEWQNAYQQIGQCDFVVRRGSGFLRRLLRICGQIRNATLIFS